MYLYIGLMIFIVISGIVFDYCRLNRKIYLVLTMGILCFLTACRAYIIGNDTLNYINIFDKMKAISFSEVYRSGMRYERGYLYFNKLISFISQNNQIILIITSIIIWVSLGIFIYRYSENNWLSLYLIIVMGFLTLPMNIIRQGLAIGITLYSYKYILNRNPIKFVLCVLIAMMFHHTAIIFIIAYPISKIKFNWKTVIIIISLTVIIYLTFSKFLDIFLSIFPIYEGYIGGKYFSGGVRLASVINTLIIIITLILGSILNFYKSSKFKSEQVCIKENTLAMFILIALSISIISFKFNLLDRISDYFNIFAIIYLPNAISQYKNRKYAFLITSIVLILFGLYFIIIQLYRPEWNSIYPYHFFWEFN
ncbi:EpsG family protein [Clostridium baratii]